MWLQHALTRNQGGASATMKKLPRPASLARETPGVRAFGGFTFPVPPLSTAPQVHSETIEAQRHVRTWLCVGCCAAPATVRWRLLAFSLGSHRALVEPRHRLHCSLYVYTDLSKKPLGRGSGRAVHRRQRPSSALRRARAARLGLLEPRMT